MKIQVARVLFIDYNGQKEVYPQNTGLKETIVREKEAHLMEKTMVELLMERRSIRRYTGERVPEESLKQILQAGLLTPSGHNAKPWEFVVVRDRETLNKLSQCREGSAEMLKGADCAVVVLGDEEKTDVWTEDCSAAMMNMHLTASSLGVGSCWIQGRLRTVDGESTEQVVRNILGFPEKYRLEHAGGAPGGQKAGGSAGGENPLGEILRSVIFHGFFEQ